MADEWLSVDQVAAETAGHHEVLTTFTDLTGRTNTLREGGCVKCGARWPCLAAQWAAQDGRWRALVGGAVIALQALVILANQDGENLREHGVFDAPQARHHLIAYATAALTQAQAALDGASPPTRGPAAE